MATTTSPEPECGESLPQILIVEGAAGPPRRRWIAERLKLREVSGARAFKVYCDFNSGGPWAGVNELFSELLADIQPRRPDLIERHALELVYILPRFRRSLKVLNPNLTDLAPPEERTRNYPADRAFRIVHGLIDLLDSWKSTTGAGTEWVIGCDDYDLAGAMGELFFRELMRRRGEQLNLRLLVGVGPGKGEEARASLGGPPADIVAVNLEVEPPTLLDEGAAAQMAADLERQVGDDRIEMQIHLPDLIRLWQLAGRPDKALHWKTFGLETYDTLGLYADSLRYADGLLPLAQEHAPGDEHLHWKIIFKLLMSHIGMLDVQASLELAEGEGMKLVEHNAVRRAGLLYLSGMIYSRYQKPRDLVKGEDYVNRALEALEGADMPEGVYHFQSVFNRNGLAMIRNFQGRFEEAIELCRSGIERLNAHLGADEHRLHRSVLLYNIAQVYTATGSFPEAIEYFSAAIAMDPNYSEYYNERGNIFLQMGRLQEARTDYLKAIDLSPPYFEVFANLGQCYRRMGAMAEAIESYSRAHDLQPDHLLALLGRAKAREELGQSEAAMADYTAALAQDPTQWEAVASRGVLRYEAGDLEG
ncbi:MAG TPA: tetratricopeptide repeat protein, partial [Blastocatellia bacterium]|nr:tetratricopeptide repeat protein [Blastocatellia bacterium]